MTLIRCQLDAYQKTLESEVTGCEPVEGGHRVTLTETILYATGGGQPHDLGSIAGVLVCDVRREQGEVVHITEAPVALGAASVEVDWARRYDHMQQHTAQHLITAMADEVFGWATMSFHLGESVCSIDVDTQEVDGASLARLEALVNAEVRAARPVRHRIVTPEALSSMSVRTRGLPEGFEGQVRLIEIEGLDLNTCGGTHVASTAELQTIKLLGSARIRGGQTRISYLAGERTRAALKGCLARERALGQLLSSGPDDLVSLVEKLQEDLKQAARRAQHGQAELAGLVGRELAQEGLAEGASAEGAALHLHRPGVDLKFLGRVAAEVTSRRPETLLLLTTGAAETGPGLFLLVGPAQKVKEAGPPVASLMEGRGGGPPGRYQGKVGELGHLEDAVALLRQIARA